MARVDDVLKLSLAGHEQYKAYALSRTRVEEAEKELEFKVGRVTVAVKCTWDQTRVFVGSTELSKDEAIAVAKGLLERLTDLTFDDTGGPA